MSQPLPDVNGGPSSVNASASTSASASAAQSGQQSGTSAASSLSVTKARPPRTRSSTIVHTGPVRSSSDQHAHSHGASHAHHVHAHAHGHGHGQGHGHTGGGHLGLDLGAPSHSTGHADRRHRKHTVSHAFSHVPSHMSGIHSQLQLTLNNNGNPGASAQEGEGATGTGAGAGAAGPSGSASARVRGHARTNSAPSPPMQDMATFNSPIPQMKSPLAETSPPLFSGDANAVNLSLYTYTPSAQSLNTPISTAPSLLPSPASNLSFSRILVSYASLPWPVKAGDYLELRRPPASGHPGSRQGIPPPPERLETDALEGVKPNRGRDSYIFRLAEDHPSVPMNQIQVPNTVAQAFRLQHRQDIQVSRVLDPETRTVDFIELHFSQYVGRADMWRLGMSLENTTVHVGEKISLAGGAVRADVQAIWKGRNRYASGIITSKTKTIFRSKSAQTYIFIQLCQETWEFDEDGERYYEKVVHGFLPDLFTRWSRLGASHLVSVVFFGRVYYDEQDVEYMNKHKLTIGLMKDCHGRWCKDFFRVVIDFERKADWLPMLADIKKRLERSEREILLDFHLGLLKSKSGTAALEDIRILGNWSFAYEGNVLEALNLALNPFDDHYIDRDLSRTGLSLMVLTPGTGHFNVDKNLLRLTTERMIDHGVALDLVCLTKMPLHSVPLFSYESQRPVRHVEDTAVGVKTRPSTPDPLYFDPNMRNVDEKETIECFSLAFWVYCSFYSKTHDKPFREDRFIPRCKMYQIQMLGILDHNLTTVSVPFLELEEPDSTKKQVNREDRKIMHDEYDAALFEAKRVPHGTETPGSPPGTHRSTTLGSSLGNSYQSNRLLTARMREDERLLSSASASPRPIASRTSLRSQENIVEEEAGSNPSLPETGTILGSGSGGMPDMPIAMRKSPRAPAAARPEPRTPSMPNVDIPTMRISSMTSLATSPTHSLASTDQLASGASTPKVASSVKKLKSQSSRGSFASRFASTWLFGSLTRSQPSFPTAAIQTVERQDVAGAGADSETSKPSKPTSPEVQHTSLQPVMIPRQTSSQSVPTKARAVVVPATTAAAKVVTQPMPIMSRGASRMEAEDAIARSAPRSLPRSLPRSIPRSFHNSYRQSRSMDDSWRNKTNAAFGRTTQHTTVNPCNPKETVQDQSGEGGHKRRWQHVRPRLKEGKEHVVKWRSLCAPACLPLTTDFMPTPEEVATFYEAHSYDIACFPDQVSFLIRQDAAQLNLPLAVMREMASQRLSQNFQFIVLPHNSTVKDEHGETPTHTLKNLVLGDSTNAGLRVGGASDVLKDASGAIYLSWSNHVHKLTFDPQKQSVTVQRFVRKIKHSTAPHAYKCLVWPYQHDAFQEATAMFRYPNIDAKLNFNYLDRLIAGEEDKLTSNLRFWRTRYLLIPSGREPSAAAIATLMPKRAAGEEYNLSEVLITGAMKVLETLAKSQWRKPDEPPRTLRLLATTFDPSTCVLDDGLMSELERLTSGKERIETGHTLEGMTLQDLADMMNKPNNGLTIRDRWWGFIIHEDSFSGEQFVEWLKMTFRDVETRDQAVEWGQSLIDKGLIEHVTGKHGFHDTMFFYRLRPQYDEFKKNGGSKKTWFGRPANPKAVIEQQQATLGTSPGRNLPLKLTDKPPKKRKIKMSQSMILDLDPQKKSDRAEVAILHSDIVHNTKNAFHLELNWLGVTAGLLDELRAKCSALAERYGLRFVEAPVEQIKDVGLKCAYRAPINIRLALAPPVIPDLHLRLTETTGSGQCINYFEHAILTQKFGFVLDVEATDRYPDSIEVEYTYRQKQRFEYSQFIHRSGLALVQCIGREAGFLWCDNRPFISAPTRGRQQSMETYSGNTSPMSTRLEQARQLREEMEAFCSDPKALAKFYADVTPSPAFLSLSLSPDDSGWAGGDMDD